MQHKPDESTKPTRRFPTVKQLAKEFFVPFLVAGIWTAYNWFDSADGDRTVKSSINVFGPAFFLASWGISQWFRVKKQQKIDSGLEKIETAVAQALSNIQETTSDVIGNVTGGESACYLAASKPEENTLRMMCVVHHGKHPLYEVHMRIFDCDMAAERMRNNEPIRMGDLSENNVQVGPLAVGMAKIIPTEINLGDAKSRRFNIFFSARNGTFTQLLRWRKVEDGWMCASQLWRDEQVLYERIDPGFPLNAEGQVEWESTT